PAPALPQIKAGKVRLLGVTSAARLPAAPDIPPLAEEGVPGFDAAGWGMVVAPARTPAAIVSKLHDAFRTVESRSDVRDRLIFLGLTPQTSPPPENDQLISLPQAPATIPFHPEDGSSVAGLRRPCRYQ